MQHVGPFAFAQALERNLPDLAKRMTKDEKEEVNRLFHLCWKQARETAPPSPTREAIKEQSK